MSNDKQERERGVRDLLVRLTNSPLYKQKLAEYNTVSVGLERIETGNPEESRAILLRDLLTRGHRNFKVCKYEESRKWFEEAVALDPRSAEAHAWLAAVYGRQIEAVWSMVEKIKLHSMLEHEIATALEIDPTLPLARRMNGARLLNSPDMLGGDPAAAVDEFRYCIDQGMDEAEVWVSLAECYIQTDEPVKAINALKEALTREPEHKRAAELLQQVKSGSCAEME